MPLLRPSALFALAVLTVASAPAGGQERSTPAKEQERPQRPLTTDTSVSIPQSMLPPAGKCRIWMRDVPARQQPAPTDCTTALRQAPANGVLVFGPALRDLSPFDVRNPWSATSSEVTRDQTRRGDSSARTRPSQPKGTPAVREATPTTRTMPAAREAGTANREGARTRDPGTRADPSARQAPPPRSADPVPPPPQTKKPE